MKGGFVKIICVSGAPIAVTLFLDSNNLFISVSRGHFILKSIFNGKFIFPMSVKYCNCILYTNSFLAGLEACQFYYLNCRQLCLLLLWYCKFSCLSLIYCKLAFFAIKERFLYFFSDFSGKCFSIASEYWYIS